MPTGLRDTRITQPWFRISILEGAPYWIVLALGVAGRLWLVVAAGNRLRPPWSGGGDEYQYVTLARNLLAGDGFSYAHVPTAFRPPLFPYLLAGLMYLSPRYWIVLVHMLHFVAGLATAWLCGCVAQRWACRPVAPAAGRAALLIALFMPTNVYFTTQVLTESIALLLGILFVLYLDKSLRSPPISYLLILGAISGLSALERFNAVLLTPVACAAVFLWFPGGSAVNRAASRSGHWFDISWREPRRWQRAFLVGLAALIVASPWLARTIIVFHGNAIYSTHSGYAAVEGVLMPIGRTQIGDTETLLGGLSWSNIEVETNSPARPELRDEVALGKEGWAYAFQLWRVTGWRLLPIAANKLDAFWLSTDQLVNTRSFSWRNRLIRWLGVAIYYVILALAIAGWLALRKTHPEIAHALFLYAFIITALHIPLTMNTRLRSPFFDPLLASLAGFGWVSMVAAKTGNSQMGTAG